MISYKRKSLYLMIVVICACATLFFGISVVREFFVEGPGYSVSSGFYEEAFELSIMSLPGARIYYTLDGTQPSADSTEYKGPITITDATSNPNIYAAITDITGTYGEYVPEYPVDKATVVRAIAVAGGFESEIATAVYYVGYQDKSGYDNVKIMSMTVEPDALFSDYDGIYVIGSLMEEPDEGVYYEPDAYPANYNIASKEMRRQAHILLWDADRNLLAKEDVAISIHGGWSRAFRQKGFNFYSEEEYGPDNYGLEQYMLRTSGSYDTVQTMFRDAFNQELVADRAFATQDSSACVLFINGEYWGIYNLEQRYTKAYFREEYGIDKDNLICVKNGEIAEGDENDIAYYQELIDFAVHHDLSIQENYDKINQMMDIQSYIEYNCFECYIANTDWPENNVYCFRSKKINSASAYEDGRWRWAAYDTDESTNIDLSYEFMGKADSNPFTYEAHWGGNPAETELMLALRQNESFCKQFANTFVEMANTNFAYETVKPLLEEYANLFRTPMVLTQNRFNGMGFTEETFDAYVANIDAFYKNRKAYVIPYMEAVYGRAD